MYVCILPNCHLICEHYNAVCDGAARCHDHVRSQNRAYLSTCRQRGTSHKMTISKTACICEQNKMKERELISDWKQSCEAPAARENTHIKGSPQANGDCMLVCLLLL